LNLRQFWEAPQNLLQLVFTLAFNFIKLLVLPPIDKKHRLIQKSEESFGFFSQANIFATEF